MRSWPTLTLRPTFPAWVQVRGHALVPERIEVHFDLSGLTFWDVRNFEPMLGRSGTDRDSVRTVMAALVAAVDQWATPERVAAARAAAARRSEAP